LISTRVCIVGAGPAGATAALQLDRLGIDCIIVDKAVFPRDKVCGDGLSGKVVSVMEKIDPEMAMRFRKFVLKQESWGVDFISPGRHKIHIPYKQDYDCVKDQAAGFVCKRIIFDEFLVNEVRLSPSATLIEGVNITSFECLEEGYRLSTAEGSTVIMAKMLIIANGAQSNFTRHIHGHEQDPKCLSAGVRGYYKNVEGLHHDHFIELHFLDQLIPGYLWIFPLPGGEANVGLDMLNPDVVKNKINLRRMLEEILLTDPAVALRFKKATLAGKIEGYSLPLAGQPFNFSGHRYLIAGDAASMIDPLTGEGIGNAMYAGRLAALKAAKACNDDNYSHDLLKTYDEDISRVLGGEFCLSQRLQKLTRRRWLFNGLLKKASRSTYTQAMISAMLYDVEKRRQLASPRFYMNLLFGK
jgi:geranylgeranyl reductase family protein